MRAVTKRRFRLLLLAIFLSVVLGATIGSAIESMHGAQVVRLVLGALSGAITGWILAVLIGGAEIFLPQTRFGRAFDRAPFVVAFAAKWILYSGAIVLVLGIGVGQRVEFALFVGLLCTQVLVVRSLNG